MQASKDQLPALTEEQKKALKSQFARENGSKGGIVSRSKLTLEQRKAHSRHMMRRKKEKAEQEKAPVM